MLYFPQLATGSAMQFPGAKKFVQRTVANESADGRTVKLADPPGACLEWRLEFSGLTDAERDAIEALFEAAEGRLGSFTFLDPFENLLKWSEDLTAAEWVKSELLMVTPGVADPLGGAAAMRVTNLGVAERRVVQALEVPGWFQYCVSLYARSEAPAEMGLLCGAASRKFRIGPAWSRIAHPALLSGTAEVVEFGASVAGVSAVELFGFQVEAQAGASAYRKTTTRSGVHPEASFADDVLVVTTEAPNWNSCRVNLKTAAS